MFNKQFILSIDSPPEMVGTIFPDAETEVLDFARFTQHANPLEIRNAILELTSHPDTRRLFRELSAIVFFSEDLLLTSLNVVSPSDSGILVEASYVTHPGRKRV